MADKNDRAASTYDFAHFPEALLLKRSIADGKYLVDEKDLRLQMRRDGESKAQIHPARVMLDPCVDEGLDPGEVNDRVEIPLDLMSPHAQDCRREPYVLAPGELGVEARAHLEQGPDTPAELGTPLG